MPDSNNSLVGTSIGEYHVLRKLGEGGMASVYLAHQDSLNRQVAVKVLKAELCCDETYVQRFRHEALAAAKLVHANIVQVHEIGEANDLHFIVQEYVVGANLKQWLGQRGPLDVVSAVKIMRQILAALHKAAEFGVTHRDIKPENVMVTSTGEVKVTDFGLARMQDEAVDLTRVDVIIGTPLYMSPEQVQGKSVDPRSDIYSLGVTCYHMLAGEPPFQGETALSIAVQHLNSTAQPLVDHRGDLPTELCAIVHRMLQKEPSDRYQSAAVALRDLHQFATEVGEEEWTGTQTWELPAVPTAAHSHVELTRELQGLIAKTNNDNDRLRLRVGWIVAIAVVCFVVGGAAAWIRRSTPLLSEDGATIAMVEKKETVGDQFFHASLVNTERAWNAVEAHFPASSDAQNKPYVYASWKQLAELYRERGNDDAALTLYDQLVSLPEAEETFRAFGFAGKANIYFEQGDEEQWAAALSALRSILPKIKSHDPRQHSDLLKSLDPPLLTKLNEHDAQYSE